VVVKNSNAYAVDEVEDQSHSHAKLFKVQIAVIVDICHIPYTFQLAVWKAAVLEDGSCLRAVQVAAIVGESREDFPILFDLLGFDLLVGHAVLCIARPRNN
jgi:hypothetical protein